MLFACQTALAQGLFLTVKPSKGLDTIDLSVAQSKITKSVKLTQHYGQIDTSDLKMTSCDFEKDANAMVLFDVGTVTFSFFGRSLERNTRIKILTEKGKEYANVKLAYHNFNGFEQITQLEAETINFENGKIEISKVDPALFYKQQTDKDKDAVIFTFPNVKAGSVIECHYIITHSLFSNFPAWNFQNEIPTRYSQLNVFFDKSLKFKSLIKIRQNFAIDTTIASGHIWAMANLPAYKKEVYMRAHEDGLQSLSLILSQITAKGEDKPINESWFSVGKELSAEKDYMTVRYLSYL